MNAGGDGEKEDGEDGLSAVHDWSASHFSMLQRLVKSGIIKTQVLAFELVKVKRLLDA